MRGSPWLLSLIMLAAGCGGDDGDGQGGPRISGRVGGDYVLAQRESLSDEMMAFLLGPTARAVGGDTVDRIAAVPTVRSARDEFVEVDLAEDGSFSLELDQGWNWLLMLVNSGAPLEQRIVAYVTMGDSGGEQTLFSIPVPEQVDDVEMGALGQVGEEAESETTIQESGDSFALSVVELETVAEVDDVYRGVVNDYLNYDQESGVYYEMNLGFLWNAPLADLLGGAGPDAFEYQGFSADMRTNAAVASLEEICSGTKAVEFVPPAEVFTGTGLRFAPDAPISSVETGPAWESYCGNGSFVVGEDSGGLNFAFGGSRLLDLLPDDYWRYRVDGEEHAIFDLGVSDPLVDGHIAVPVPIPTVELDSENVIQRISVAWYAYTTDEGGSYVRRADPRGFDQVIDEVWIEVIPATTNPLAVGAGSVLQPEVSTFSRPWKLVEAVTSDEDLENTAVGVSVGYRTAGNQYAFHWGPPPAGLTSPYAPDLEISNVSAIGGSELCAPTAFDVEVSNVGTAGVTVDLARLVTGDPDVVAPLDLEGMLTLGPGESTVVRLDFQPSDPSAPPTEVIFTVDPEALVTEQREDNNQWPYSVLVSGMDEPDLRVASVTFAPAPATIEDTITMEVVVENVGLGPAFSCSAWELWTATAPDGALLSAPFGAHEPIWPGESSTLTMPIVSPGASAPGTYGVTVRADPGDHLVESDETNNELVVPLEITSPDLVVSAIIPIGGGGPCPPQHFEVEVTNQGTAPTTIDHTRLLGASSHVRSIQRRDPRFMVLGPGERVVRIANIDTPLALDAVVSFTVDPSNDVSESDESNNTLTYAVSVDPPAALLPDVIVDDVTYTPNPAFPYEALTSEVTLSNVGAGAAFICPGELVYVATPTGGVAQSAYWTVGMIRIDPGMSEVVTTMIPPYYFPPGDYDVTVAADPFGTIAESDETNNTGVTSLVVNTAPRPDLVVTMVTPVDATASCPPSLVDVQITNQGLGQTTVPRQQLLGSTSAYVTNADDASLPLMVDLMPAQSVTVRAELYIPPPVPSGDTITLTADPLNVIDESDESNNEAGFVIPMITTPGGTADLIISRARFAPNPATTTSSVLIWAYVQNVGSEVVELCSQWTPVRVDNPLGSTSGSQLAASMVLAPGEESSPFVWGHLYTPGSVSAGSYNLTFTADPDNQLPESDETNNTWVETLVVTP